MDWALLVGIHVIYSLNVITVRAFEWHHISRFFGRHRYTDGVLVILTYRRGIGSQRLCFIRKYFHHSRIFNNLVEAIV